MPDPSATAEQILVSAKPIAWGHWQNSDVIDGKRNLYVVTDEEHAKYLNENGVRMFALYAAGEE